MDDQIAALAREIQSNRERLHGRIRELRENQKTDPTDSNLAFKVQKTGFPGSVGAVDSGLISYSVHGADIVAVRTAGVIFRYQNSKLETSELVCDPTSNPQIEIANSLDEHDGRVFVSLVRLKHELTKAIEVIRMHRPEMMLMDGSLVPLPCDRPSSGSELAPFYAQVVALYHELYATADNSNTRLCGAIKDSRSRRIARGFGFDCSDSVFFDHAFEHGERSAAHDYFDDKNRDNDFENVGKRLRFFYMKVSIRDIPLRIEFLKPDDSASIDASKLENQIASKIFALSDISENFAYPAVLVEADLRAAMDQYDAKHLESTLASFEIKPLRRNDRPFR